MGQISKARISIIIGCLLLTGAVIYWQPASGSVEKKERLNQTLSNIDGWKVSGQTPLEKKVVEALQLDDYVFSAFSNGRETVHLYVGYYVTTKKVGAAHDPLVCFPGQGWVLSDKSVGELKLDKGGETAVSYSSMIAQKGTEKELLVYWFQSYDKTSADTFNQKLRSLSAKLGRGGEDNAFVRVSIPMSDRPLAESKKVALEFIKNFYPVFLKYVRDGNENK
jgi:EpsI family protein